MAKNFIAVDREQGFLMPPDLRESLPEGHLLWCVLDAVAEMDLSAFYVLSWSGFDGGFISRILSSGEETLQSWRDPGSTPMS
jgi:hypothetical protein